MRLQDLEIRLRDDPSLDGKLLVLDLEMILRISQGRTYKMQTDDDDDNAHVVIFLPVNNGNYNASDPIPNVLRYGLRNGLFLHGRDLEIVLQQAALRPERRILWHHPGYTICPGHKNSRVLVSETRSVSTLSGDFRKILKVSGMDMTLSLKDFRCGAASDICGLSGQRPELFATVDSNVVAALHHSWATFFNGTTARDARPDQLAKHHAKMKAFAAPAGTQFQGVV